MKRIILALCAFLCMTSAFAGATSGITQIDVSRLTPEQRAALLTAATQMESQPASTNAGFSETMRKEVEKWGELGTGMGRAAVSAAKEVGVATNDFVQTPLGKITMGVVLYKVMGHDLIKFAVGTTVFVVFLTTALVLVFRRKGNVKFDYEPRLWGAWHKKVVVEIKEAEENVVIMHFLGGAVCTVISLVAICNAF